MRGTSRFTISLPTELLEAVDDKLVKRAGSRSEIIRGLLEAALREAQEQEDIERYVRGYQQNRQTEEELGWSDAVARERLAELPHS